MASDYNEAIRVTTARVLSVMDELIRDINVLSRLPETSLELPESFQADPLISEFYGLEGSIVETLDDETVFRHKTLTRRLLHHVRKTDFEQQCPVTLPSVRLFETVIRALRSLTDTKLHTTVEQDAAKFQILRDAFSREQHASADVKALREDWQRERVLRETEVARRDSAIRALVAELESVQAAADQEAAEFAAQSAETLREVNTRGQAEMQALTEEFARLEARLSDAESRHAQAEGALRQEKGRRVRVLEGVVSQYDRDLADKQSVLQGLADATQADVMAGDTAEDELAKLNLVVGELEQTAQTEQERVQHRATLVSEEQRAAETIQAFFRGFHTRLLAKVRASHVAHMYVFRSRLLFVLYIF